MTAMVHVALARHHVATGDDAAGIEAARAAVRCCPTDKEACLLLAQLLLAAGEHDAAIDLVTQAAEGAPLDDGVLRLIEVATRAVAQRYPALVPPAPDPAAAQGASGTPR